MRQAKRNEDETEAGQLYRELHAVIWRWIQEGDKMTTFGVLGALEAVKLDVAETLKAYNETK